MLGLILALALARPTMVVLQSLQTVTLAWTPNGGVTTGYVMHFGTARQNYPNTVDVGNVSQWTSPVLPADTYYFAVSAYDANGDISSLSNEAGTTLGQGDPCAQPLGQFAVAVFVTTLEMTSKAADGSSPVGSQARLNFQIGSPNAQVNDIMTSINGADTDPGQHASGTKSGGVWFTTPLTPGSYPVTLTVTNTSGCTATATKDAGGNVLTVVVK